jgi:hypothetical protein
MARLRDSGRLSLSTAALSGNPTQILQPETVSLESHPLRRGRARSLHPRRRRRYSSTIAVTPAAGGGSTVEWRGAFYLGYPNNDPPPDLNDEAAMKAVSAVYRGGLDALKAKLEKPAS